MSNYTQFNASMPDVVAATSEVIYDKYWLKNFRIMANDPTKPVRLVAVFVAARDVTIQVEGVNVVIKQLKPNGEEKKVIIDDLFTEAETDAALKSALEAVLAVLNTKGAEQGVF